MRDSAWVFIDIDDVLVDFTTAAANAHGLTREELEARRKPGVWSIQEILGITDEEFWEPILEYGPQFWLGLERFPWIGDLLDLIGDEVGDRWALVTAPSSYSCSHFGKVLWIKEVFGVHFDRFLLTPHKHLLAKEGRILIDDREENCLRFEAAGGRSILFPTPGNKSHSLHIDPIDYTNDLLEKILE